MWGVAERRPSQPCEIVISAVGMIFIALPPSFLPHTPSLTVCASLSFFVTPTPTAPLPNTHTHKHTLSVSSWRSDDHPEVSRWRSDATEGL